MLLLTNQKRAEIGKFIWIANSQWFIIQCIVSLSWKDPGYSWKNNMVSDITDNKFSIIIDDEDNLDNRIIIKTFLEFKNNLEEIFVYVMKNNNYYLNSNLNTTSENKLFSLLKKEDVNNYNIHIREEYVIVTSKNFF